MEVPLLQDIAIIFALSIGILLLCHKIHLPNIVAFIITGILCGPHALRLISDESSVQTLADIGIVLLLFIVGLEFSFKKLLEYKRFFLIGGFLQVGLTVIGGFIIGLCAGSPPKESLFLGFLISLSSTAIVLRLLAEKMESDSPHGKVIVGMMIFQDIVAIPMMLMIPILAGTNHEWKIESLLIIGEGILILAAVIFSAVKLVPSLLYYVAKTRNKELFLLTVFTICTSVAWITSSIGLSLSLGAFLAGLIISDSEYRSEAIGDILPFQDIFTSFFFVSVGMLLDVGFFLSEPIKILLIVLGIQVMKASFAGAATFVLGMPLRTVVLTAVAMSQIGEFSFVLAKAGAVYELGSDYHYQLFLSVALLTMALTPTLMQNSSKLASLLLRLPLPVQLKSGLKPLRPEEQHTFKDHTIIIGYGISGRHLAHAAREAKIPYLILEMNAETVKKEKLRGEPIHFGDAMHESVLHHARIAEAKAIAVVINDPVAVGHIVEVARKLNPHIYIIVRIRYLNEMKEMYDRGADDVIPDEFGSSLEVFTRVLKKYEIPNEHVQEIISDIRVEGYQMYRLLNDELTLLKDKHTDLPEVLLKTFHVQRGAPVIGKTLGEVKMRNSFGVTAVLLIRGSDTILSPTAETNFLHHDIVVVMGSHENLVKASSLFQKSMHHHNAGAFA